MKFAAIGVAVAIVGLVLGVDGLLLAGGFWVITGLLARMVIQRRSEDRPAAATPTRQEEAQIGQIAGREGRAPGYRLLGLALLLVIGLGSMAIGFFEVGFPADYESLRWIPLAVGILARPSP